jgi:hypothetical protein
LDLKILVHFSLFSPASVSNPHSSPLLLQCTTPTSPFCDGKHGGRGRLQRPRPVASAPRRWPSMKGEDVAAAASMEGEHGASVACVEGEHGASVANTAGSTSPTMCLQLPTSPATDPPSAAPGCLVPNAHRESSLHYASSGFAA